MALTFSSQSATLPAAEATGNMTLRPNSIVTSIIYDDSKKKATGVRILDAETMETKEYFARVIFLCASALGSTSILLNSKTDAYPGGLGSSSGELGHNLMDHHFRCGAEGYAEGFEDKYYKGRRPNGIYIPRFRNLDASSRMPDFIRGYGYQGGAKRERWERGVDDLDIPIGGEFKDKLMEPGPWMFRINGFGECLPYHENKVSLNTEVLDKYGLPTLTIDCEFKENEMNMRKDMQTAAAEMLDAAGFKGVDTFDDRSWPGLGIHEMGHSPHGSRPKNFRSQQMESDMGCTQCLCY